MINTRIMPISVVLLFPVLLKTGLQAGKSSIVAIDIKILCFQILYQTSGMKFSEELSDDERKYISRGFLPLIGQHMYQLVSSSVEKNIICEYRIFYYYY